VSQSGLEVAVNHRMKLTTAMFIALTVSATAANAQTTGTQPPPPARPMVQPTIQSTLSDEDFIVKAAEGGMKELEAGKLGVQKATHADVKAFAQRIVTDHTKANTELMGLAKMKNVTLKTSEETPVTTTSNAPPPPTAETPNALNTLSGEAFDRAFMDQMVKDHETTVALFEAQARDGKDADVKAWAAKTLPTLKAHQKEAQELQARIGR
jgi:putative membrane protein